MLADRAEKTAAAALAVDLAGDFALARRARATSIDFQVLAQSELPPQLEEAEGECARLVGNSSQLGGRESVDFRERAGPRAEQHLVLDDVADAREDALVQQDIGDFLSSVRSHLTKGAAAVPTLREEIGRAHV